MVRVPTSRECVLAKQEGSPKLCALLGFSILRFFLFASAFFWSGFLCSAQFQFLQLRTYKFDILPKSVIVLVVSEKELIAGLAGLRKK